MLNLNQDYNKAYGIGTSILNGLQTGLDVAGLVPGLGEIADGANALIYLGRGDYGNAALSAAAARIPHWHTNPFVWLV